MQMNIISTYVGLYPWSFLWEGVLEGGGPTLFYFVDTRWRRMGMNLLFSTLIENWENSSNS